MHSNPMHRRIFFLLIFSLAALVQISPTRPRAWVFQEERLVRTVLPEDNGAIQVGLQADLDSDGQPERLELTGTSARIESAHGMKWQSPSTWQVIQAAITDLNRDGTAEVALLVWRPWRPWPVDEWLPAGGRIQSFHDRAGDSCHLILIGWKGDSYGELWAGSALAEPVRSFRAADLDGDGLQELLTLEGSYSQPRSAAASVLKVWRWNGFGFSNVYKMEGIFHSLALVQDHAGRLLILVP
jgi:hypothetical protein